MIPKDFELRRKIMDEVHYSWYSIHPGINKMYQDLKKNFWWTRMKQEIAKYVSECDTCRRIKADHLRPAGNLQPLSIPEWKWENIYMNFIMGLPCTSRGYNSIWVIIDRLTKFSTLHTHSHDIQGQTVCRAIHIPHCLLSRRPEDHHLR
jgi:hypothetical protein